MKLCPLRKKILLKGLSSIITSVAKIISMNDFNPGNYIYQNTIIAAKVLNIVPLVKMAIIKVSYMIIKIVSTDLNPPLIS